MPTNGRTENMKQRFNLFIFAVLILIFLPACSARKPVTPPVAQTSIELADIRNFPQNLEVYAKEAGASRRLLPEFRQEELNATFDNIFFGPWDMNRTSVKKREMLSLFSHARGYKNHSVPWLQYEWDAMRSNAAAGSFPSMAAYGITLRNTDLRELPTHEPRFSEPTENPRDNPFDNFQMSLLPIGTPLLVVHKSQDGRWYFIECPVAGGWVDANDVGLVDAEFRNLWRNGSYAALVKDKIRIPGTGPGGQDSTAGIGVILPLKNKNPDGSLDVLVPLSGSTYARTGEIRLSADEAQIKPVPLTPGNVARIGNRMMNQPYGWGGMLGERDCSATTRELLTPFGIWLPRNSVAQAKRGMVISLAGMTAQQKAETIMREGVPFLSLVGMRGHITLYVGIWKGRPAIFHNAWGLRIIKDGDDNDRFVIGRAVVTSITPGIELENLYRPVTFVDRLRTLSTPGK